MWKRRRLEGGEEAWREGQRLDVEVDQLEDYLARLNTHNLRKLARQQEKLELRLAQPAISSIVQRMEVVRVQEQRLQAALAEGVRCTVCLEVPGTGPMQACPEGHLVCQDCQEPGHCRECDGGLSRDSWCRSLLATTVMESILVPCGQLACDQTFPPSAREGHKCSVKEVEVVRARRGAGGYTHLHPAEVLRARLEELERWIQVAKAQHKEAMETVQKEVLRSARDRQEELELLEKRYTMLESSVASRLECPVCLEVPARGPVFTCRNGHLECSTCYQGAATSCPTCRLPMGEARSLLADTVIENILHQCATPGCPVQLYAGEMLQHREVCPPRAQESQAEALHQLLRALRRPQSPQHRQKVLDILQRHPRLREAVTSQRQLSLREAATNT